jgi:signal transduction histidine kinase
MWVGVDEGLYQFSNGRFRRLPEPDRKPLGMVVAITEDINGDIWAECAGKPRQLVRIRDFQVREHFLESQVPAGHSLAADPKGGIWIGTLTGDLVLFRNGAQEKQFRVNLTGDSMDNLILAQADGSVLAGSTDGLFGLREGTKRRMSKKNGLPCNWVYSFVQAKEKQWWLYTECGIVELSETEFQRWWANPETIVQTRVYDALDGARASPPSFNSAAYSSDGRVWFATGSVVQMVDPSRLAQKFPPAPAYVESVIVDRKELAATDNLKLAPHPRDLQIDYTSPTFAIPQKIKFRYRLDGYDHDWHEADTRRQAFYTDLPPGKYSFRVIASNSDGVWNDSAAKLDFSVTPAYYQTNWFRALGAALFLTLLWAAYQWRVRQLAQQFNMRLEDRVSERTRIARDLHDTLLQSFQGVLLRFQLVHDLIPTRPAEAKQKLESAIDQAAQAIGEGRDAIQGLRSSTVEKNDLALAIRTLGEELTGDEANPNSAVFHVGAEGTPRDLHPILRDEIYRIAGEALRNAFRHAEAKQIEVELRYDVRQFRLRVRDDGKGIDAKLLKEDGRPGHYGLRGMRERAKSMGGKLTVWSELDSGTELELTIPASNAYAKSSAPGRFWLSGKLSGKDTEKKS